MHAFFCIAGIALSLSVQGKTNDCFSSKPFSIFKVSESNNADASLSKINNEAFGLELDLKMEDFQNLKSENAEQLELIIPVGQNEELILSLTKNEIFHEGSLIVSSSTSSSYQINSGHFYSGSLQSDPSKKATISIFSDHIVGFITDANGMES